MPTPSLYFHQTTINHSPLQTNNRMAAPFKTIFCLLALLLAAAGPAVHGAGGACGNLSPDKVAVQLAPCAAASRDPKAAVSSNCCLQVQRIGRNPKCLCAVLLSATAKAAGVKPAVAITIPKRCRFANRPVGFKCGPYTLP